MNNAQLLKEGLAQMGIPLPEKAQFMLLAYLDLLYKWNKTYNLTSLGVSGKGKRQSEAGNEAVSHHLLDSLSILPFMRGDRVLDVGSGGGTPGIPLAIARPEMHITLADSNAKKCAFLRQAVIELALSNVSVHEGRIEQYQPEQGFSEIVSRAFAELSDFVRLTAHLLDQDGRWLAMKGQRPDEEISRLPANIRASAIHSLSVPQVNGERHLVELEQTSAF